MSYAVGSRIGTLLGLGLVLGLAAAQPASAGGGGNVMPPTAQPNGYSLDDMAAAMANFSTSFNDPAYYPKTPFQILYFTPATHTFTVKPGTPLFLPILFVDDSDPILGDFPADAGGLEDYYFGEDQIGIDVAEIIVDGKVSDLGPAYAAGPIHTSGLLDGTGTNYTQLGAFLTPLSKGTHTITYRFFADGDALIPFGGVFAFEDTYTVIVK
jgi:hypothetical protein